MQKDLFSKTFGKDRLKDQLAVDKSRISHLETHNLNEQSVRLDFDISESFTSDSDNNKNYIKSCNEQGILPIHYGVNKRKDMKKDINLNNKLIGDQYAEALASILPNKKTEFTLSLSNNRLSQKGIDTIMDKMNSKVRKLDISYNSRIQYIDFSKLILNYDMKLTSLNIEENNFGDNMIVKLSE